LILVSAGEQPSGPCSIAVVRIMPAGRSGASVEVAIQGPGPLAVQTHPWQIVSVHGKLLDGVTLV
jgi:hypothetical protein